MRKVLQVSFSILSFLLQFHCTVSLRILLTNNNGLGEIGLQSLKTALRENGHDVFVYAPAATFQGASAALTLPTVEVTEADSQEYSVGGYPATCVLVGITAMTAQEDGNGPDLILSGINDGFTSGSQDLHSGTLGGALTGLAKGIPSIAVLTDSPSVEAQGQEVVNAYFQAAANFVVGLVDTLQNDFPFFPEGVGLKVIYPAYQTAFGVLLAQDNSYYTATFDYQTSETEANTLEARIAAVEPPEDLSGGVDTRIVQDGFVAVLPIQSDISVGKSRYNEKFLQFLKAKVETQVPVANQVGDK